jgi:hypothetical protein
MSATTRKSNRFAKVALLVVTITAVLGVVPASAAGARWSLVGKEKFNIDGIVATVPTYVNTNSVTGDRTDQFTVTFQGRFNGRKGIDHVNIGVIVDCGSESAYADQYYVYYSKNKSDYTRTDGGDISTRIENRALSFCR